MLCLGSFTINSKEHEDLSDINALAEDLDVIRQIKSSREDRKSRRVYHQEDGLDYFPNKFKSMKLEWRVMYSGASIQSE